MTSEDIVTIIIQNTMAQYDENVTPKRMYTKEELIKIVDFYMKKNTKHNTDIEDPFDDFVLFV